MPSDQKKSGNDVAQPVRQLGDETFDAGVYAASLWLNHNIGEEAARALRLALMADPNEDYTCGQCGKLVRGKFLYCSQECIDKSPFASTRQVCQECMKPIRDGETYVSDGYGGALHPLCDSKRDAQAHEDKQDA